MSMPPAAEAMTAMRSELRSTTRLKYSSRSMPEPGFDVDVVDRQTLRGRSGASRAACRAWPWRAARPRPADFASLTPPALPRPPAWTCAFTTQRLPPSAAAAAFASCGVVATWPLRNGNAVLGEQNLRLILVQIHWETISATGGRRYSPRNARAPQSTHAEAARGDQVEFRRHVRRRCRRHATREICAASSSQFGNGGLRLARPHSSQSLPALGRRGAARRSSTSSTRRASSAKPTRRWHGAR